MKTRPRPLFIVCAGLLHWITPAALAEPDLQARLAALEQRLDAARVEHHIPGMALAVVLNDEVILARGFGMRDLEQGLAADPETKFAIGSSSKAFTSLLVGMMVDEGKMSWDEPIRLHAPEFRLSDADAAQRVTIRDLLCHRSGLGRTDLVWMSGGASREQIFEAVGRAELAAPLGQKFQYNNLGYMAVGLATAQAAGASWEDLIRTRIFAPLGMEASDTSISTMLADPRASKGYMWDEGAQKFRHLPMRSIDSVRPAGAINSSILDMSRWVRLQLGRGQFEGQRLISEDSLAQTWTRQIEVAPGLGYGLGWMLREWNGTPVVEHGGNIDGFAAQVALLPDRNAGFVLLTNVSFTSLVAESQGWVWEALFPAPADPAGGMTAAQLAPYAGKFRFAEMSVDVTVLEKDGRLYCDVPGQTAYELKWPDADGKWAFALTDTIKVAFEKAPDGSIPSLTMYQAGLEFKMPRVSADGTVTLPAEPGPFTADQLREFTGTYHFAEADHDWRVLIKNDRLAIDVPGQTVYTLKWPDADGFWFFEVTPAIKVSFERAPDGSIARLLCHQGGQTSTLPRTAPGDEADLPTIDALMALRLAGAASLADRGAIRITGAMRLLEQGIDATFLSLTDPAGPFRFEMNMGPHGSITMACDGHATWAESLGAPPEPIIGEHASAVRRQATFFFPKDLRATFATTEVLRREMLGDRPVIIVRARSADASRQVTEYIDAATGLPLKEDSITTLPGLGPVPASAVFDDYRDFDGLMLPGTVTIESPTTGRTVLTIESVATGDQAGPEAFRAPAQTK
jgi:CubicO group peptidase (beta-lactamase class C family)